LEAIEELAKCVFKIKKGVRAGIDRSQGIHQHDLLIEPGKMIAKERAHNDCPVRFISPSHHRPKRAGLRRSLSR
jgi:hypothetical protein